MSVNYNLQWAARAYEHYLYSDKTLIMGEVEVSSR
jgi:hypothetical protein